MKLKRHKYSVIRSRAMLRNALAIDAIDKFVSRHVLPSEHIDSIKFSKGCVCFISTKTRII